MFLINGKISKINFLIKKFIKEILFYFIIFQVNIIGTTIWNLKYEYGMNIYGQICLRLLSSFGIFILSKKKRKMITCLYITQLIIYILKNLLDYFEFRNFLLSFCYNIL